ncbi:MAG: repeat-associated core protein, partial [Acidobacteriota bacterium]|nr:repeat-associated core protein [Acidobacteriota bacterium]
FLAGKTYLKKSSLATNTINKLNSSKIPDIKIMAWDGASYFSGSTLTIYWNPNEGNLIGPGQVQSPSLILAHECLHALRKLEDPQGQLIDKSIEMEDFDDMEEFRVIVLERSIVKQINKKLKNGPFESIRDSHNVVGIPVVSPTSKKEMK